MFWSRVHASVRALAVSLGTLPAHADSSSGLDILATDGFAFGPFATFSLARFNSQSLTCNFAAVQAAGQPCPPGGDIHWKAFHEWLVLGVRAVYDP